MGWLNNPVLDKEGRGRRWAGGRLEGCMLGRVRPHPTQPYRSYPSLPCPGFSCQPTLSYLSLPHPTLFSTAILPFPTYLVLHWSLLSYPILPHPTTSYTGFHSHPVLPYLPHPHREAGLHLAHAGITGIFLHGRKMPVRPAWAKWIPDSR